MEINESAEVKLLTELGGGVTFSRISFSGDGYWAAVIDVETDWFRCSLSMDCSIERVIEFIKALKILLANGEGAVEFINEEANVDIRIKLNKLGNVRLMGEFSRSMSESSMVRCDLRSDLMSLEGFFRELSGKFCGDHLQ